MSNQSSSPDPTPAHQPGGMHRVPGNRTPRRVQWASAVDEHGVPENALESDAASNHELDEAGLDVRMASVPKNTLLLTHPLVHSQLRFKRLHTLLNVTVRPPHYISPMSPPNSPDCLHRRPHQVGIPQKYCHWRPMFPGRHSSTPANVLGFLCNVRQIRRVRSLTAKRAQSMSSVHIPCIHSQGVSFAAAPTPSRQCPTKARILRRRRRQLARPHG